MIYMSSRNPFYNLLPDKQQADELDANELIGFLKYEIKSRFLH